MNDAVKGTAAGVVSVPSLVAGGSEWQKLGKRVTCKGFS